ncbi:flagellin [Eilatimonas milleporae]|uniref:Flagellin n=1 Tax=Eilatimonas milleporae TaxID=911205 RepID=A0A3M0CH78_9PROT|nr:flagellin [Eilatimonas milleporae]RMB08971.1 flagellin [Eilatimonas milleporae]
MAFSVNTNAGALAALRNLNTTNAGLQTTQNRINTGLAVAGARDGAATFNIAQTLRADVAGLNSVQASLNRASSALDVAIAGGEAISDLLIEARELAVAAADEGLDSTSRTALNDEFVELRDQIDAIAASADFNGTNAINTGGSSISAITNDTGTTNISVAAVDLSLSGLSLASTVIGTDASTAATAVTTIDAALTTVNNALSDFGAFGTRLDVQQSFTTQLSDSIEVGIGNLVDADLAQEAANLQALQVQQQLGLQALSIANQAPQAILGLFG